jgi:hypothetical protein
MKNQNFRIRKIQLPRGWKKKKNYKDGLLTLEKIVG